MKLADIDKVISINSWRESLFETARQLGSGEYLVSIWVGGQQYNVGADDPLMDDIKNWIQDKILDAESRLIALGVNVEDA